MNYELLGWMVFGGCVNTSGTHVLCYILPCIVFLNEHNLCEIKLCFEWSKRQIQKVSILLEVLVTDFKISLASASIEPESNLARTIYGRAPRTTGFGLCNSMNHPHIHVCISLRVPTPRSSVSNCVHAVGWFWPILKRNAHLQLLVLDLYFIFYAFFSFLLKLYTFIIRLH